MASELIDYVIVLLQGYFMQPTVITGLADSTRCMQEEIFGQ